LTRAKQHAASRVQFGEKIGSFELVKEKLAFMEAGTLAMESATMQTAALIDAGASEYMLETAMLKVFSTEVLWQIVNDTFQIHGGMAYFADEPFERLIRDARINTIGEGANDVLRAFIALVGMRDVGLQLQGVLGALANPLSNLGKLGGFAAKRIGRWLTPTAVAVTSAELAPEAEQSAQLIRSFGAQVERLLRTYREEIVDRQYQLARVADAATELYVSRCVLSRLDATIRAAKSHDSTHESTLRAGRYYLLTAGRRIRSNLHNLWDNDDDATTALADKKNGGSAHS
jgi:alkylation response protein AidB-like acyl-CoA dehydrogenase